MSERGWLIAHDRPASIGGREVLFVLDDGRRIPVVLASGEYSPETVAAIGDSLARRDRRAPASKGGRPQRGLAGG